ncbi:TPA_asm: hypothetical protein GY030_14545, partial [Listeria monocytogenes]|nr:hypothetical protein [Listeria monocytogenes]
MRDALGKTSVTDTVSQSELDQPTDVSAFNQTTIQSIEGLQYVNNLTYLFIAGQQINQESIPYQPNLVLPNVVKDGTGSWIAPATISNNGTYTSPNISWNLPNYLNEIGYTFSQTITIGGSMD